jgi:2-succinyl-5-enolpyruvyl-6-hydroxy-3-cyclohexene-1-carboxylate synthase
MSGTESAPNPSTAQARVIVDELARLGVTDAVVAPGSRSAALAIALAEDPRLAAHVLVDERSAGFLAVGLGRATGRPAVVVVTSGTAVANLHPAVLEASHGGVPLLVLSADRPPELRATGANQTIDQRGLFGGATRWSVDLPVAEDRPDAVVLWRTTIARAVAEARGLAGPAGPVHVDVAFREPTVPASDDGRSRVMPTTTALAGRGIDVPAVAVLRAPRRLADEQVAALAARAIGVERGLIVVGADGLDAHHPDGPLAARREAAEAIASLSAATGWPIAAEAIAAARHVPGALTAAHHLAAHAGFARAHRPDLVVRIGRTGLSRALAALLGRDVPQVLIDPDGAWHDPERSVAELVVADVADTCRRVAAALAVDAGSAWSTRWHEADARVRAAIDAVLDAEPGPCEPRVARDLAALAPDGTTLVVASSMPVRDLDLVLRARPGLEVVANRGVSGIDGTVATTLGIALARGRDGGGPVLALLGDLALLHDANALLVAPDAERIDATLVVIDNDGGGIFSFLPPASFPATFERVFATPHGRDLADVARTHRLGHRTVEGPEDLAVAVREAIAAGGIHLVVVRTDRADNVALHRRMSEAAASAIDALAR